MGDAGDPLRAEAWAKGISLQDLRDQDREQVSAGQKDATWYADRWPADRIFLPRDASEDGVPLYLYHGFYAPNVWDETENLGDFMGEPYVAFKKPRAERLLALDAARNAVIEAAREWRAGRGVPSVRDLDRALAALDAEEDR